MIYTDSFNEVLASALDTAKYYRHEFVTPEHILNAMLQQEPFCIALEQCMCNSTELRKQVNEYLENELERVPSECEYSQELSFQMNEMMNHAYKTIQHSGMCKMTIPHIVQGMLNLRESWAAMTLRQTIKVNIAEFLGELTTQYDCYEELEEISRSVAPDARQHFITCLNDKISEHTPLIGRHEELEHTLQILCRKERNNVLFIGDSGVGKSHIVYGLAAFIESGKVPQRLQGCKIYELNSNNLFAGIQFRGDLEQRIKSIMEAVCNNGKAIIYIDDIHNLVGTGHNCESAIDASNILKPYFERKELRIIGTSGYEEYSRNLSRNKSIIKHFQQINITEPSIEESIEILKGVKSEYENFHGVNYEKETIEHAVNSAAKFINDRALPDKAIDLIDEAGSYRSLHPTPHKNIVNKAIINKVIAQKYKINTIHVQGSHNAALTNLHNRLASQIYGQDDAIREIVDTIEMSRAGLLDDNRPIASFLFIGATGTGKTETAKTLAKELNISLVRFDMSEYSERHTVAKLIGSPAGYIGYDDGGLLTEAIHKTPHCLLLLDEIEKAHHDIFNLLLQVMDHATLTDNKGRKADFRNVILIMTSNIGAEYAGQSPIGFSESPTNCTTMQREIKKVFKPEFLNRLSGSILFNPMNRKTATLILDKKLRELETKLRNKNITMSISDEAKVLLLQKGYSAEYGAREMERTITSHLKRMLTKEILFGRLQNGGTAHIHTAGKRLIIKNVCRNFHSDTQ